jgi:hypothetical protein
MVYVDVQLYRKIPGREDCTEHAYALGYDFNFNINYLLHTYAHISMCLYICECKYVISFGLLRLG